MSAMLWLALFVCLSIYDKLIAEAKAEATGAPLPGESGAAATGPPEPQDAPQRPAGAPGGAKSLDVPVARQTDPDTSWAAAESIGDLTERQQHVLDLYRRWGEHGLTDERMVEAYHLQERALGRPRQTDSGLRTRRSELTRRGLLEQAGVGTTASGRQAIRWRATIASGGEANLPAEENA